MSHSDGSPIVKLLKVLAMATFLTQLAGASLCATCILYGKSVKLFQRIPQAEVRLILRFFSKIRRLVDIFGACLTDSASTLILAS